MTLDQMFTLAETLSVLGLLQCVFILAIVILKAADIYRAAPTVAFFTALGLGFGVTDEIVPLVHTLIPALSYLLVIQIAFARLPAARHLAVLVFPLLGPAAALTGVVNSGLCTLSGPCPEYTTFLRAFAIVPGAVVLLALWLQRGLLAQVWKQHDSHDRYWVVLTLIAFNALNLGVDLLRAGDAFAASEATLTRAIFGLTFVYLVTTLMFRIEPKPVVLLPGLAILRRGIKLTPAEQVLAIRIRNLMIIYKLYLLPTFSRADLARELDVSEFVVSRVISRAFATSFHKLLNAYRVDAAKVLLRESDLHLVEIAFDVGFYSLNAFIRVFQEITGQSPSEFRAAEPVTDDLELLEGGPGGAEVRVEATGLTGKPR